MTTALHERDDAAQASLSAPPRRVSAGIAADQLKSIVERIERMQEEAAGIASDIRDIFAEAKGNGLDCPTIRKILKLRKMDAAERDEADALLATYSRAVGLQPDLFDGEAS